MATTADIVQSKPNRQLSIGCDLEGEYAVPLALSGEGTENVQLIFTAETDDNDGI
jgi:hypothetical protein